MGIKVRPIVGKFLCFLKRIFKKNCSVTCVSTIKPRGFTKVDGALEAGSPTCRLNQSDIVITLHGDTTSSASDPASGSSSASGSTERDRLLTAAAADKFVKGIVVTGGDSGSSGGGGGGGGGGSNAEAGRLDLHGKLFHPTWTRLAAHVPGRWHYDSR
jgi:hypothetical protein